MMRQKVPSSLIQKLLFLTVAISCCIILCLQICIHNNIDKEQEYWNSLTPLLMFKGHSDDDDDNNNKQKKITYFNNSPLIACIFNKTICNPGDIGLFLESTPSYKHVTHIPKKSVPERRRIPASMANNATYIGEQRHRLPINGTATPLFEYNPTILPLYKTMHDGSITSDFDDKLLDYLTGRYHPSFTDEDANKVKYISVERSTNHNNCANHNTPRKSSFTDENCFIAFALLDEKLQVIPKAEILIEFDYYLVRKYAPKPKNVNRRTRACILNDVTIFAASTTKGCTKKDQLFLMPNESGSGTFIIPVDLRRTPYLIEDVIGWNTKIIGPPFPVDMRDEGTLYGGEGLQVRIPDDKFTPEKYDFNFLRWPRRHGGYIDYKKNYHIFEANGTTYLETSPSSPHICEKINLVFDSPLHTVREMSFFPNYTVPFYNGERIRSPDHPPSISWSGPTYPSFETINFETKAKAFRGTACCIDMNLDGKQVKVGISHSVTDNREYLSSFYAFDVEPPFDIVAFTGYFCLGSMNQSDIGFSDHWVSKNSNLGSNYMTLQGANRCPVIQFLSGFTEMVGDKDHVIISYGVSDCYSRSVIVQKAKIQFLLMATIPNNTSFSN